MLHLILVMPPNDNWCILTGIKSCEDYLRGVTLKIAMPETTLIVQNALTN